MTINIYKKTINIHKNQHYEIDTFHYAGSIGEDFVIYHSMKIGKPYRCKMCGSFLLTFYIYIIKKLEENNLLPEDYEMLCCECYDKKKRVE